MADEDGRLKDEVVEELRKRRNDDSELVPHEEVEKQVRDDDCEKSKEEKLREALDNRTEDPEELLDADDLDVDASDVQISFPEDDPEPAAWIGYNAAGGAGLVPSLTKISAEQNTGAAWEDEYPKPLFTAEQVIERIEAVGRGDHRSGIWYGRCYNCMDVNASTRSWFECKACGKENRHPAHPCDRDKTAVDVKGAVSREKLAEQFTQEGENN